MTTVAVLGASGGVGRELVRQALDRGDEVLAISRHPEDLASTGSGTLHRLAIDVFDLEAAVDALRGADIVLSALGVAGGDKPGVLTAGVRAVTKAAPPTVVSVGALGTGSSASAAGPFTRSLLGLFLRAELPDKRAADAGVLALGGTVVHVGPMKDGPVDPRVRNLELAVVPRRFFPATITRATVAAAMLSAADDGPRGHIVVPVAS